jgi:hypothetical protein
MFHWARYNMTQAQKAFDLTHAETIVTLSGAHTVGHSKAHKASPTSLGTCVYWVVAWAYWECVNTATAVLKCTLFCLTVQLSYAHMRPLIPAILCVLMLMLPVRAAYKLCWSDHLLLINCCMLLLTTYANYAIHTLVNNYRYWTSIRITLYIWWYVLCWSHGWHVYSRPQQCIRVSSSHSMRCNMRDDTMLLRCCSRMYASQAWQ